VVSVAPRLVLLLLLLLRARATVELMRRCVSCRWNRCGRDKPPTTRHTTAVDSTVAAASAAQPPPSAASAVASPMSTAAPAGYAGGGLTIASTTPPTPQQEHQSIQLTPLLTTGEPTSSVTSNGNATVVRTLSQSPTQPPSGTTAPPAAVWPMGSPSLAASLANLQALSLGSTAKSNNSPNLRGRGGDASSPKQHYSDAFSVSPPHSGGTNSVVDAKGDGEYSTSRRGDRSNGSQSFCQESAFHNELEEHQPRGSAPFGLMDPSKGPPPAPTGPLGADAASFNGAPVKSPGLSTITSPNPANSPSLPNKSLNEETDDDEVATALPADGGVGSTSPEPEDFYVTADKRKKKQKRKSWREKLCNCACPASCGGYNFVKVFLIITFTQVVLTCVLVWLVGYLGLVSATNILSGQIRDAVMSTVVSEVNSQLTVPLRAASAMSYLGLTRFGSTAAMRRSFQDQEGYLADIMQWALKYPSMARMGMFNANNAFLALQRSKDGTDFSSIQHQYILLSDPTQSLLHSYQPAPIPERNLVPNKQPLDLFGEIRATDSAAYVNNYLGQPNFTSTFQNDDLVFYPYMMYAIGNDTTRQRDPTITTLGIHWSPPVTTIDRTSGNSAANFLSLVAYTPTVDPITGEFAFCGFALLKLRVLEQSFKDLPIGESGMVHVVRAGGDILASSYMPVSDQIAATQKAYKLSTSEDAVIQKMHGYLLEWGLVVEVVTNDLAVTYVPFRKTQYSASFSAGGNGYRIEAKMLDEEISGLPYTVVLITLNSDFDGGVTTTEKITGIVAGVICAVALFLSFMITRCLTRPLLAVVEYMDRAVKVISMDRGQLQREALGELCANWAEESGMVMPPLLNSVEKHEILAKTIDPFSNVPLYASFCWLCNDAGDTCCCYRVGRSLREVQMMHAAFGSMLYTLASYDELEAINQAKRQFIRYIFHEVRVPFNAIVMGIEQVSHIVVLPLVHPPRMMDLRLIQFLCVLVSLQMQLELAPHQLTFSNTIETLDILREQSAVVSRILNDVLSMQKIEDGALALEYDTFSLEKMIRGALYAFRTPCLEKRLKVRVNLANLDQLVNEALPGLRLGKPRLRGNSKEQTSKGPSRGALTTQAQTPATGSTGDTPSGAIPSGHHQFASAMGPLPPAPSMQVGRAHSSALGSNTAGSENSGQRSMEIFTAQVRGDPYRLRQCLANFVSVSRRGSAWGQLRALIPAFCCGAIFLMTL
jgi:signal transduction histidine kinase